MFIVLTGVRIISVICYNCTFRRVQIRFYIASKTRDVYKRQARVSTYPSKKNCSVNELIQVFGEYGDI